MMDKTDSETAAPSRADLIEMQVIAEHESELLAADLADARAEIARLRAAIRTGLDTYRFDFDAEQMLEAALTPAAPRGPITQEEANQVLEASVAGYAKELKWIVGRESPQYDPNETAPAAPVSEPTTQTEKESEP